MFQLQVIGNNTFCNIKDSFKLLKKIKDPKFEIDRLDYYSLSLHLGKRDFQVLITDTTSNRCMLLEDYVFHKSEPTDVKLKILEYIFDDHHLLMAGFWKSISFSWKNKKFSFVPSEIFSEEAISGYLKLNADLDADGDRVFTSFHPENKFVNVFAGEKSIAGLVESTYPNKEVRFIHQSSVIADGAMEKSKHHDENIIVFVDRFTLHVVVMSKGHLKFYNQFPIVKFEDYLKYIRLVATELNLDLINQPISIYGYLGKKTPHFLALQKKLQSLKFGDRPENMQFSYVFDEITDHQYFDLFSIYLAKCLP
jgi:hypothetical protein